LIVISASSLGAKAALGISFDTLLKYLYEKRYL
jgi:hypothetical protein